MKDKHGEELKCMEERTGECQGEVEYRESLSGTGTAMKRCNFHHGKALDRHDQIVRKYDPWGNGAPPRDFDPSYAGERWDEDD